MSNQKLSIGRIFSIAGALMAFLIGSGFATGQEIMQYYSTYGYWGVAVVLLVLVLLIFISLFLLEMGFRHQFVPDNEIYPYMFGNTVGRIMDIYVIFFIYLSFVVMVAGARATGMQQYNFDGYIFVIVFTLIVALSVFFGLDRLVDIIGNIGPIIIVLTLVVAVWSIGINADKIPGAMDRMLELNESGLLQRASNNWLLSALSYIGFVTWWLIAFLVNIGKNSDNIKDAKHGVLWGSIVFALATAIVGFAIFINLDILYDSQIPTLMLAADIHPWLASIYSITVLLGIYTTAVSLLWTVVARFFKEKTNAYRIACLVFSLVGLFIGTLFDFDVLVNYIYVINGYLGVIFILAAVYYTSKDKVQLWTK